MKVVFLGYGNMAKALAHSFLQIKGIKLYATSPSLQKACTAEGIITNSDNKAAVASADIVILSVKPSKAAEVLNDIRDHLPTSASLISVAAGLNLAWLEKHLHPHQPIIRCMPNIPIAVGQGATPFVANQQVNTSQRQQIEHLFSQSGLFVWLNDETMINPLTALSGSGPAYVCLFLEAMIHAGEKLGIDNELAAAFSLQTFSGAIDLLKSTGLSAAELRTQVTSPAGTTEAALSVLIKQGFENILFEAMQAACKRSVELGID